MPRAATNASMKRGLAEASNTRANVQASPRSAKKLKLDNGVGTSTPGKASAKIGHGSFNSSQPAKSRFEEEVLEKMTQDIETLRQKNTEKDQQWRRPDLPEDFNERTHSLTFQQIEAEEGVLNGGKPAIKLFGVTEVSSLSRIRLTPTKFQLGRSLCSCTRHRLSPLLLRRCTPGLPTDRLR